ncbi:virulence-associated E family protein [Paracerasibacillus soli]|uniref:Virulence-associated E family protein n=2 Tax=Paracerasibacillus soli TaxID=480284 RepID=A0ABU5CUT1_9BACI|nr:virulence-associated E family protein [Virgibacillus soli]MDY0410130.1 virulence-associated E family protein [Virgibacillus soli]
MNTIFYKNSYHPIKEYLKGLYWDGESRLESLFIDFLGADDNEYTRTVTKKMLVAAVTRIFEPGTKFDTALILIGTQGIGKSYVLSRLGGEWFNESLNSFSGDEALMKLRNSWIIELAELSALKHSEVEEVKAFISATVDTYRPKYSKNIARFPRQCVFFGSTNSFEFLKDTTGNRRFFPLPVNKNRRKKDPFESLTDEYIDQVWAEAYQLYLDDEPLHITDESVKKRAEELQREHTADDGQLGVIEEYIRKEHLDRVCARQVWHECLMNDKEPKYHDITDINDILRQLDGWKEKRTHFGRYGTQRGFIKNENNAIEN